MNTTKIEPLKSYDDEALPINGRPPLTNASEPHKYLHQILIGAALLCVGLAVGAYYFQFIAPYESTDDAFIEAHVIAIAPQLAGRVARVLVNDNQEVKQGDLLLEIAPADYQAKLDRAQADLVAAQSQIQQANAQLTVDQAKVGEEKASVMAAQAEAKRAEADSKRYQAVGNIAASQSQLDLAGTQASFSEAQVDVARNKELAAEAQVGLDGANLRTAQAEVQMNEAQVRQAQLDLSYTRITAPESGFVTHRTVEPGAYVQPGQSLLAIVPRQVWVVANFKETQLTHMRAGETVEIKVDAYPSHKFTGRVDSIQIGSGAQFSLFPPENATGNYIKVLQRVPVKIFFDDSSLSDSTLILGPGMSVEPKVRVQ